LFVIIMSSMFYRAHSLFV